MNVTIRNAIPEDVRGIQEVFHETWLNTYPNKELGITVDDIEENFKNAYTEETLNTFADKIKNLPPHVKFLVAVDQKKVIGLCRVSIKEEYNQLNAIYILPEYQGNGIGNKLWEECVKYLNKDKKTIVQVATYNSNAIKFYEKLGFKDNGKRFTEERHRMSISKVLMPEMEMVKDVKN